METTLDIVVLVLVAGQAAWLGIGVFDNIRYPAINRDGVAEVLRMESLKDYPKVEALVGHRRIHATAVVRLCFALIVAGELFATALLWAAVVALAGDLAGLFDGAWVRVLAMIAVLAFTSVWAGFLIGGQWFYYWFGAHGQPTHFYCLLWGIATMAALAG